MDQQQNPIDQEPLKPHHIQQQNPHAQHLEIVQQQQQTGADPAHNHHYVYDGEQFPLYEINLGHYAACENLVNKGCIPDRSLFVQDWENVTRGLKDRDASIMTVFWQHQANLLTSYSSEFKLFGIPLARIKKLMKTDEYVQMISSEVIPLMAQAADLFVAEFTMRAWMKARDNSRRTLQRSDLIQASMESDMYDFLIDILPREATQEAAMRRPAYPDATIPMRASNMNSQQLLHTNPAEFIPEPHGNVGMVGVGVDYQSGVGGMYGIPSQQQPGSRVDDGSRKSQPLYLYESIAGTPRAPHRPTDPSLQ